MDHLELYLNNIIRRQERLEKVVLSVVLALLFIAIFAGFLHTIFIAKDPVNIFTGGTSFFAFAILGSGLYVILRLHACMNGCDLIKVRLLEGGLQAAEEALNNTLCTVDIDTTKLKELFLLGANNGT